MIKKDDGKKRPTREEAKRKKWLKRLSAAGVVLSGALVALVKVVKLRR